MKLIPKEELHGWFQWADKYPNVSSHFSKDQLAEIIRKLCKQASLVETLIKYIDHIAYDTFMDNEKDLIFIRDKAREALEVIK